MCNHPHIVRLYGSRQDAANQYLLLEYASGGELFDRIGMMSIFDFITKIRNLFSQLLSVTEGSLVHPVLAQMSRMFN